MLKNTLTCFALLIFAWLMSSGLLSNNELDTDGFLRFGLPLTVYTDFHGNADGVLESGFHIPNLLITLSVLLLVAVCIAFFIPQRKEVGKV